VASAQFGARPQLVVILKYSGNLTVVYKILDLQSLQSLK
jgi:hypothetical protein